MIDYAQARRLMVDGQLRTFDVNDIAVLDAFDAVPRERFAPAGREAFAYSDQPLKLAAADGDVRVMPAPMVLARMVQALKLRPGRLVLDVGTGHGYGAAILRELGARVIALESLPELAEAARERLGQGGEREAGQGIGQGTGQAARIVEGPLEAGAAGEGPYDAILIEGRVETRPGALLDQLKDDGRLVCVYGPERGAKATIFVRAGDAFGARPLFDAALPGLKAFAAERAFTF